MNTCPNCGAENRDSAFECRLCAAQLNPVPAQAAMEQSSAPDAERPASMSPAMPLSRRCPDCKTENEADWSYCQGCGKKLEDELPDPATLGTPSISTGATPKPDTGRVVRPPRTKFDEPPPQEPESVETVPVPAKQPVPIPAGGPASRRPQPDYKPAPEPPAQVIEAAAVPAGLDQKPAAGNEPPPPAQAAPVAVPKVPAEQVAAPAAPTPPVPGEAKDGKQPELSQPQQSWQTVAACRSCGAAIPYGAAFCAGCGKPLSSGAQKKDSRGAVIEIVTEGGKVGDTYPVIRGDISIGRIEGDVTFPHDGYMSSRHARIVERDGHFYLTDQDSRNGTFIRIRTEVELKPGDTFLVGKQVLRFDRK